MSSAQSQNGIGDDWLVDTSDLIDGHYTRAYFYNPLDDTDYEEILLWLEHLTLERIAEIIDRDLTEITYEDVQHIYVPQAKKGKLKNYLKLVHGSWGGI